MTLQTTMLDPATLILHPKNPRQGDVGAITESIQANGWYGVVVRQKSTGYVLVGNHRTQAAITLGIKTIPVQTIDVDDTTALRIVIADNRASDLASNDEDILTELLKELIGSPDGLRGTLFDGDDLDHFIQMASAPTRLTDVMPDAFPEAASDADHACPKCGYQWS